MIRAVKRWLFNRQIQQLSNQLSARPKPAINTGREIALLTNDACDDSVVQKFITDLRKQNREVHRLHFSDTPQEEPPSDTFSAKQLNWYGWPDTEIVLQWMVQPYDILLVLTTTPDHLLTALASTVRADLKVGATDLLETVDLVIEVQPSDGTKELVRKIYDTIGQLSSGR